MPVNDKITDTFCNRIIFKEDFDPKKDIYISYETPSPTILTEGEENILTEDGFTLLVENEFFKSTGFVTYITKSELDEENGEPGIGLGLLATTDTAFQNVSGHLVSVAVDIEGGYALSGVFKDSGDRGSLVKLPNSITARVSNSSSEYDFLSSSTYDNLSSNAVDIEAIRVGFKDLLSIYTLDVKVNGTYSRILEAQYNFNLDDIPERVKIGISHSGGEKLFLKDITYSGVISG